MQQTAISLCAGGGGASLGMQQVGVQLVGAIEYDPAIAAHYASVVSANIICAKVEDIDYSQWVGIDGIQASPSCKSFSSAKVNGQELETDRQVAYAIARAIRTIRPRWFWLEQVRGYATSESCGIIRAALDDLDYWSHSTVVNAQQFGVPQDRDRYILRAVQGGLWQAFRPLPAHVPSVGWYAATADLWADCMNDQFAPWQLARLPEALASKSFLLSQQYGANDAPVISISEYPAFTISSSNANTLRAFLVNAQYTNEYNAHMPMIATTDDPSFTITNSNSRRGYRAWLEQGVVKRASLRCLARWQGVPDSYMLPTNNKLGSTIIGNMVPPPMAYGVTRSIL